MRQRKLFREKLLNYFLGRFFDFCGRHVRDGILCFEYKTLSCISCRGRVKEGVLSLFNVVSGEGRRFVSSPCNICGRLARARGRKGRGDEMSVDRTTTFLLMESATENTGLSSATNEAIIVIPCLPRERAFPAGDFSAQFRKSSSMALTKEIGLWTELSRLTWCTDTYRAECNTRFRAFSLCSCCFLYSVKAKNGE